MWSITVLINIDPMKTTNTLIQILAAVKRGTNTKYSSFYALSKWHDPDMSAMKIFHLSLDFIRKTFSLHICTKHIVLWKFLVHCGRMSWCWIYNTAGILLVSNINIERSHHAKLVLYERHSETTFTNIDWKKQWGPKFFFVELIL